MHISSRYAKILGETNFRTREIPRSGSKAEDGGKREKERLNNGQATHGARKQKTDFRAFFQLDRLIKSISYLERRHLSVSI